MSARARASLAVLGFLAGLAFPGAASPAAVTGDSLVLRAFASQGSLKLGEPVDIALELVLPAGATAHFPGPGADLGPFELRAERTPDPEPLANGLVRHQKVLTVTTFTADSTSVTLPSLTAEVTPPGAAARPARSAPLVLGIITVLPGAKAGGDTVDLKPLKAVVELPGGWPRWPLWLALAVALGLVALYLWRRRQRRRLSAEVLRPVDTRPCDVIALEALAELRTAGLARRGAMKQHYGRLTDILRPYLEQRFGFPAVDLTTTEILTAATPALTALDPNDGPGTIHEELTELLTGADLVKFAKLEPPVAIAEGEVERAADFVRATAPSRLPPFSPVAGGDGSEPGSTAGRKHRRWRGARRGAAMRLAHPWLLLLLLLVPLIFYRERARRSAVEAALRVPDMEALRAAGSSLRTRFVRLLPYLETAALILCVLILARPQSGIREREVLSEGIDIVLAMDISGSMKAMDLKPNRLIAAKEVAKSFVEGRQGDRVGLVVFASDSFTQCPLTLDYGVLTDLIDQVDFGVIEDGTAIGMGIANASNRLRESKAKSKVIILLTDGVNNAGRVDPITAARLAKALGIRIYTVGAGVEGEAPYPVDDPVFGRRTMMVRSTIDEKTLGSIAEITGGEFFRARDEGTLKAIYERISTMEKTTVESREFVRYDELGPIMLLPAFILLAGVLLLESTLFLKVP